MFINLKYTKILAYNISTHFVLLVFQLQHLTVEWDSKKKDKD